MYLRLRNILLGFIGALVLFLAFLYSDQVMVGFSEFAFLSGTEHVDTVTFEITGGFTTGFTVYIENKEQTGMTYKLGFVDAGMTNDSVPKKTCLSPNETQDFGQYITGDTTPFTLPAQSTGIKNISVTFPTSYSGIYNGCVTLNAITNDMNGYTNTLPVRGIFLDATVYNNAVSFIVKAYPSNRVYQTINNSNTGVLRFYSSTGAVLSTSDPFILNDMGTGEALVYGISPGTYYIAFRGQSHLASYLSDVTINALGEEALDFTTGTNLFGTQNLDDQTDNGYQYQTAGDMINTQGKFDHLINGNDLTVIISELGQSSTVGNPKNLNGDDEINSSDIGIVGTNFLKQSPFYQDPFNPGSNRFIWL